MTPDPREERLALNEARVREVNATIERASEKLGPAPGEDALELNILCECGTRGCDQIVEIDSDQYRTVRDEPTWFVVVPDHVQAEIERVVRQQGRFSVVEKMGNARAVAELTDPEDPNGLSLL